MPKRRAACRTDLPATGLAFGPARNGCSIAGRFWVERDGKPFISWGRIRLLECIEERGSLSAAARDLGMGYRHAWELVQDMNLRSPRPLVAKAVGGPGGGGAALTPDGHRTVANFWRLVDELKTWMGTHDPRLWLGSAGKRKRRAR
jgi:molybdate transport system regulatory protein